MSGFNFTKISRKQIKDKSIDFSKLSDDLRNLLSGIEASSGVEVDPIWSSEKSNYYTKEDIDNLLSGIESGGIPGGSDKSVQYNSNGSFAGDSNLTWDSAEKQLTVSGVTASNRVEITQDVLILPVLSEKPSNPPTEKVYVYYRNGHMYYLDENGVETEMCQVVSGISLYETDVVFNFNGSNGQMYTESNPNYGRVRKGEVNTWPSGDCYIDTGTKKYGTSSLYTDGMGNGMYIQNPSGFDLLDDEWCWEFWAKIYDALFIPEQTVITCGMGGLSLSRDVYQIVIVYDSFSEDFKIRFAANKNNSQIAYYETENLWGSYTPTDWNHFAIERDKSHSPQLRVFVNGTEVTVNQTTAFSNSIETTGRLLIGGVEVSSFYGWIDDVRFRRSKPYTSNFTPPGEWR